MCALLIASLILNVIFVLQYFIVWKPSIHNLLKDSRKKSQESLDMYYENQRLKAITSPRKDKSDY